MTTSSSNASAITIPDFSLPTLHHHKYLYYEKYDIKLKYIFILSPVGLLCMAAFWNFHLAVTSDRSFLKVGFSHMFKRHIPIHLITEVEIVENVLKEFGGLFYRINPSGEYGYVSKVSGPGLRVRYLRTATQVSTVVFNCGNPLRLHALLTGSPLMTEESGVYA